MTPIIKPPLPLSADAFGPTPKIPGALVNLVPLGLRHLDDYMMMLADPEGNRLTGSVKPYARRSIVEWLTRREELTGRADWAIMSTATGGFVGEVVLNQFEPDSASANFRIALSGPANYGRGFGTAAGIAAVHNGFSQVGLHRISLEVFSFNARARRSYAKVGFQQEGIRRDAHHDHSGWHDVISMALLTGDPRPEPAPQG